MLHPWADRLHLYMSPHAKSNSKLHAQHVRPSSALWMYSDSLCQCSGYVQQVPGKLQAPGKAEAAVKRVAAGWKGI